MQIIAHRRNTIEELEATPAEYGIEMDIRSCGDRLIVTHEPFMDALNFEEWLGHFRHKTLILNIKEGGIEYRVKEMVEKRGISDYFFLDLSFPYLVQMVNTGEKRVAVRFSEFESLETVLSLAGKADWVWVDCFTKLPLTRASYDALHGRFKLCIVSPELQGRSPEEIRSFRRVLAPFEIEAVCTRRPDLWLNDQGL
jgi:hypothetical protein